MADRDALTGLSVRGLDVHYGAAQALRSVSLDAHLGQVTAVLGRNGVGKTSLLRAIVGHLKPTAGQIEWNGKPIAGPAPYERARRGIAYVPQGREIFPLLSVHENLATGLAALSGGKHTIEPYIYDLFPVLKDMLRRRGGDLSGGQQQQLAIVRALTLRPRLLILDEPTEGIEPSIIKDIARALEFLKARGDMAILLVEQYFEFARDLADSFVVMDRGRIVLAGTRAEMIEVDVRRYMSV